MAKDPATRPATTTVIEGRGGGWPVDADAIAAVRAGRARIRQTPGDAQTRWAW